MLKLLADESLSSSSIFHLGMAKQSMASRFHLFTIRIWLEETGAGRREPRGHLTDRLNGKPRPFQGWSALVEVLDELVREQDLHEEDVGCSSRASNEES